MNILVTFILYELKCEMFKHMEEETVFELGEADLLSFQKGVQFLHYCIRQANTIVTTSCVLSQCDEFIIVT